MSSLWLLVLAPAGRAHEITPTIADMELRGGVLRLELRINAEALLTGIGAHDVANTDDSVAAGQYDALRAMPPEALARQVRAYANGWLTLLTVNTPAPLTFAIEALEVPRVGDLGLPRHSRLVLAAELPRPVPAEVTLSWPAGAGDLVLRQQGVEDPFTGLIVAGTTSPPIPLGGGVVRSGWSVFAGYVPVGFDHILPKGADHILFVLGLFFLSTRMRPLLWQVSAFTLAHTVTLALGALGWVSVPATVVEPLIAASIAYVGIENLLTRGLSPWRPFVVFGFGLLHGLGFASVLGEFGLPPEHFVPALIGFNVGVELGQLTVIAVAFLTVGFWFGSKPWYRARIANPASLIIAVIGTWWFVERVWG